MAAQRVLVTGGNAGIGLALCKQLLVDHGCHVYLCSRSPEKGKAALDGLGLAEEAAARCTVLQLDVESDESVAAAAAAVKESLQASGESLYAVVNNAGTGLAHKTSAEVVMNTNLYGPKRVCEAFLPLLSPADGRIVNVGSGAGPKFIEALGECDEARTLMSPDVTWEEIDALAKKLLGSPADRMQGYGLSKACVTAYTQYLAKIYPKLLISCISPGFIKTGIVKGFGAKTPPEEGTISIKHCLFGKLEGSGWYYGSDAVRSPLHFMRNPGEPAYDGKMPF
eukprot:TRINITY_DN35306_c0_g1_i1.p2 TRINITY_DN35306_c0_g1~~TRINITY_DN35306_c0_g1_i1.p2  ORF type:complete len:281 (+),score=70.71 TRINITY_DN35306_c0_g1_i1:46-888(+)